MVVDVPAAGIFGASGSVGYAGYYAGFADVPESEVDLQLPSNLLCIGDDADMSFIGSGGIDLYNFYYTINGVPFSSPSTTDTLFLPIDTSTPGTFTYILNGIETYDLDTLNLCFYPSSSTQTIIIDPCGLPVELIDFLVRCEKDSVFATWKTVSERDNDFFKLAISSDGEDWIDIMHLNGAGNSVQQIDYSANITPWVIPGQMQYLKLIQVDYDGTIEEFPIASLSCGYKHEGINVYPNPSSGSFVVQSKNEFSEIKLQNSLGQLVLDELLNSPTNTKNVNVSHLSNGVYYLTLVDEHNRSSRLKIILGQ